MKKKKGRIVLSSDDPRVIDAEKEILGYYGVDYKEIEHDKTIYLFATCENGISRMVFHDLHELKKPPVLRRPWIKGATYLGKIQTIILS